MRTTFDPNLEKKTIINPPGPTGPLCQTDHLWKRKFSRVMGEYVVCIRPGCGAVRGLEEKKK